MRNMPGTSVIGRIGKKLLRAILRGAAPKSPRLADRREMREAIGNYRRAALIFVAAKLRLADLLADGPRTSAQLAETLGAHRESLHRVLRALTALGVCAEERDGRFASTAVGALLRDAEPGSVRGEAVLSGEEYGPAYGGLLHTVMTGQTAFDQVFAMSSWEHRARHPELAECFNHALQQGAARAAKAVLAAYDFSPFRTIADVGGGHGTFLAVLLKGCPSATGILFDAPGIVAAAAPYLRAAGVSQRVNVVAGSFFEDLPGAADVHVLKSVLHDWTDEQSIALLRNCHRALPENGKVLLIERLLPTRVDSDPGTIMVDLHMLAMTGGRERPESEYRALLKAAGFRPGRIFATRSPFHILEGVRCAM
jgi:SAM-dependent methyltransferase